MTQAILTQIINQLEMLEPEELQQLNQKIKQYLTKRNGLDPQDAFHKSLINSGIIKKIKTPSYKPITERQLVQIEGKPISETIIEERR
ncbi:hypothetical protein [Okeania sp. KiyG1]|uniref:hypothetical protein n=1 Tax=Okeania sp. KiyG1 TaxID=2720165 RepID=UPI00192263EF|nr:hypothetical protein [Okeania sp. KiyG1]GGA09817.1 hypothetical protein CYANOKiyG1_22720 [Okeania sp. KiyG1]